MITITNYISENGKMVSTGQNDVKPDKNDLTIKKIMLARKRIKKMEERIPNLRKTLFGETE